MRYTQRDRSRNHHSSDTLMTGVWVGVRLPPIGSGVTSTLDTSLRLPGTATTPLPADVTLWERC